MIRSSLRTLLEVQKINRVWAKYRAYETERRYHGWTEKYGRMRVNGNWVYNESIACQEIREHLQDRNIQPKVVGQVHSFIATLTRNWGIGMVYELEELGRVSVFDWEKYGFSEADPNLPRRLPELNDLLYKQLVEAHSKQPIDWILITCSGNVILKDTLRRIRDHLGIPLVNQWLDCKQNFEHGIGLNGQDEGQCDIAPEFDIVWTSSRSVCEWYKAVGSRPLFLPEGFSPRLTPRLESEKNIDVGFLGSCYGLRRDYIETLRRARLNVAAVGQGWTKSSHIPLEEMGSFFGKCKVNLGMGGIGYSMNLTTLKGRDFEVPGAGGVYLTTYNPDLAQFFYIGEEIICYHTIDEMVELACTLVHDEDLRKSISENAYNRSMLEHRWLHRFKKILGVIGVINLN